MREHVAETCRRALDGTSTERAGTARCAPGQARNRRRRAAPPVACRRHRAGCAVVMVRYHSIVCRSPSSKETIGR